MGFVLLGTEGCHLCEEATTVIMQAVAGLNVDIWQEDIVSSEHSVAKYGTRIPVFKNDFTGDELDWPFSPEQIRDFIMESPEGNTYP